MQSAGLCGGTPCCQCDPYYVKCFTADGSNPANSLRVAFPSQLGTTGIDPAIPPATSITNVSGCLRMNF